ncbi:MAG: hypothetical protein KBC00_04015 [Candidatus Levybacteria bacterium]|nr:hypothetical protein [Candidatus Levybacteria bacterium]MBP9815456.1 hypothetical protein [Candidatus Levybacteria bacterium]
MRFNKKIAIIIAVISLIIIVGAGAAYFLLSQDTTTTTNTLNGTQEIKKISSSDIGLEVKVRQDKKGLVMTLSKLDGVESIEYSISYDAEVEDEGETITVPRGVEGSPINISGQSTITKNLDLGTCSRNVCKYDKVVSDVTVTIRVNYKDGTIGGLEEKISLNN